MASCAAETAAAEPRSLARAGSPTAAKAGTNRPVSPTVLQSGPNRLFFFSSDRGEPVHVHVARERKAAKLWLGPVRVEYTHGSSPAELRRIEALVVRHEDAIRKAWHEYFGGR